MSALNKDANNIPSGEHVKPPRSKHADKKNTKSRRWSSSDTAVVIVIVLALAGIIGRLIVFGGKDLTDYNGDGVTYAVEFTVDEMYKDTADSIKAMDTVTLLETGDSIGYVAPYDDYAPAIKTEIIANEDNAKDGKFVKVAISRGTFFCNNATYKDGCLLVADGGKYIAPGSQVQIATPTAILDIKIVKISVAG